MKRFLSGLLVAASCAIAIAPMAQVPTEGQPIRPQPESHGKPREESMTRAGSMSIDLRKLPPGKVEKHERPEREPPEIVPIELPGSIPQPPAAPVLGPSAPAPAPLTNYDGLDFANWGAGHPPDTNGDASHSPHPWYPPASTRTNNASWLPSPMSRTIGIDR